jgi:hypothetical protein
MLKMDVNSRFHRCSKSTGEQYKVKENRACAPIVVARNEDL